MLKSIFATFSTFWYLRQYLANGLFYVRPNVISKYHKDLNGNSFIILINIQFSKGKYKTLIAKEGCTKRVFIVDNYAYSFYKRKKYYFVFLKKYENVVKNFKYNFNRIIDFDDKNHVLKSLAIIGENPSKAILLNYLVDLIAKSPWKKRYSNNTCKRYYVCFQHGDAKIENAFLSNNKLIFIDYDYAGFFPILFDCFYVCRSNFDDIINFEKTYKHKLSKIFKSKHINYNKVVYDYYLSLFVNIILKVKNKYNIDLIFRWLSNSNIKHYPKTKLAINSFLI